LKNEYYDSEEFKEILDAYERSLEQGTIPYLDTDDFSDVADYYLNTDMVHQCIECVDKGLELYPDEPMLLSVKSSALIYLHRYKEAEDIVDRLDGDNDEVFYQRAQLEYAYHKNSDKAEEMFTEWVNMEHDDGTDDDEDYYERHEEMMRDNYIHVITSFIELTENRNYDEELVKRWVEDYLVMFSPLGNYDSDLILADMVRDESLFDMVVKVYGSLLETNPYLHYGWTVLAAAQYTCEMYEEALESTDFALAINPKDWDSILTKAHCFYSTGRHEEALPYFEQYIKNTSDNAQYLAYAICLLTVGKKRKALANLKKSEAYYEKCKADTYYYADGCYEMAEAYLALDKIEDAERLINKAVEARPEVADFKLQRATIMLAGGKLLTSISEFISYISANDDVAAATLQVAARFILFHHETIAIQLMDAVEKLNLRGSDMDYFYPYRALAYVQLENYEGFLRNLKLGSERSPDATRDVLSDMFPEGMNPRDYYQYMVDHLTKSPS